ncbi:hypothetical protein Tco_0891705 [Tanacetum coccineum]|uniref:Reverse transcriptase domain-containing protein n=1 Tax=Tanacetum coccineum TaxID=301880 RepID=A0ABQ5C703_9ASTR
MFKKNLRIQEVSQHSESRTSNVRGEHQRGRRSSRSRSIFGSPERTSIFSRLRRDRSESPRHRPVGKERRDEGVFNRLGGKEKSVSAHSESRYQSSRSRKMEPIPRKRYHEGTSSRRMEPLSESEDSETNPFTPWIRYFDFPKKTRMPNNVKTYDESDDLEDHLKIFQAAAKVERWAMPTWCHMFNSTLTGSGRKRIKDPVEIHHIKQREDESTKDFVQRFKNESRHVKRAPECMRISILMHGITNPELIKRLHDNIPKSVDEMMRVTTTFLRGEVVASNHVRKRYSRFGSNKKLGENNILKKGILQESVEIRAET